MTIRHEIETLSFVFIASMIATITVGILHHPKSSVPQKFYAATPFTNILPTVTPTLSPTPALVPEVTYLSQSSSDGKEKVNMKEVNSQGMKTYTFTVTDVESNTTTPLFSEQVATESSMKIPFNTFSPDNKYVFLEKKDNGVSHYLVFQASGEAFAAGSQYIDATALFGSYSSTYARPVATGWADNALLIINAVSTDGHSASFWMEVPSGNFTPLSNYFP